MVIWPFFIVPGRWARRATALSRVTMTMVRRSR
jgi:hypothetical protein